MPEKFEESYFQGWYKKAVGEFSQTDLEASIRWFWAWVKKIDEYIPIKVGNGRKVLEIGCSIGAVSHILADRGFDVLATDVSVYAVENAKKLTPKARFQVYDIQNGEPLNEKFDIVLSFEVVEHLENPQKAIENMVANLAPGGKVLLSTPYPYKWNFRDVTHINVKYPEEWVEMMKKSGLKNVEYHRFGLIPFFYRFNKNFQVILPFKLPLPYFNSPIYFIGEK